MQMMIKGEPAAWTPAIQALWAKTMEGKDVSEVVGANYFTPRLYVDQYNRGSDKEGFCYWNKRHQVFLVAWSVSQKP